MKVSNYLSEPGWKELLESEFSQEYFSEIESKLLDINDKGNIIYPPVEFIFHAFNCTPLNKIKVIILGQDPYHKPNQAMGMSFSVPKGIKIPPSLKNIFKEMVNDVGSPIPEHGDLSSWSEQGVLLLNAILTVSHKQPASHQQIGWQFFTDRVIELISTHTENVVFMLWGNFAQKKSKLIDDKKHLILKAAHPSPLARGAFFGSRHFSKANNYLQAHGKEEIAWTLT